MNATLLRPLLNRGFELPKDDWYQLAPFGEFPVMAERADGTKVRLVQVLDSKACAAITNRFNAVAMNPAFPGMLIDKDHFSQEAELPSEAMGWIFELANRDGQNGDGGLWARIRWSDVGAAAVKGGSYRFISPCFDPNTVENLGNARIRPLYLDTAGLTNAPNIRGSKPLSNRRGDAANPNPNNEGKPNMDLIRKALGLAVDADEAACVAAITPLKNRITPEALASRYVAKPGHETIVTACTALTNRIARTLFAVESDVMVLRHGFIKNTQATSQAEIDLAEKRFKEWKHGEK